MKTINRTLRVNGQSFKPGQEAELEQYAKENKVDLAYAEKQGYFGDSAKADKKDASSEQTEASTKVGARRARGTVVESATVVVDTQEGSEEDLVPSGTQEEGLEPWAIPDTGEEAEGQAPRPRGRPRKTPKTEE